MGKEVKLSLFADDMILYIENSKDSTRKLLELINKYIKVEESKIKHRNPLHPYTLTICLLSAVGSMSVSYTLTMRKQEEKLRKQFHSPLQRKE